MGIMDKISGKKSAAPKAAAKKPAAKKEEKAPAVRGALAKEGAGDAYRILRSPVLTEKSARLQGLNQYVFVVAINATKVDVARAIKDLYGVKPTGVRVIKSEGKNVRFGRFSGKEKDVKKAIDTLKKGDAISVL